MFARRAHALSKHAFPDFLLNEKLLQGLEATNITKLTEIQHKALPLLMSGEQQHTLIHAESGQGKTLTYLLPLINAMYADEYKEMIKDHRFVMDKSNESQMFQNADEIYHRDQKLKTTEIAPMKGAIILTGNKMLSSQIYAEARRLDTSNTIRFNRMTGSLTLKTPIVEFITPEAPKDDKKPEKEYTESELFEISMSNVINNSSWKTSDVLITSPLTLNHTLKRR